MLWCGVCTISHTWWGDTCQADHWNSTEQPCVCVGSILCTLTGNQWSHMQAAGYIVILPMIMDTSPHHVIYMVQQLPPNPLHHSVYTYIVCRYRITVCLSETTSGNGAITHLQGGHNICVALPCIFCWRCLGKDHWFPVNAWVEQTLPSPPHTLAVRTHAHTHTHTHTSCLYSLFQCSSLVRGNNTSDYTQHGGTHGGT